MRILFLSHRYTDTTIGGLAEFLHFLPLALKSHGIDSILYTQTQDAQKTKDYTLNVLNNQMAHYAGPFLKPKFLISKKELLPLLHLCKQEKIDLIHAQGTYRAGYMAMHVQKQLGIPYVVTSHSDILKGNSERIQRINVKRRCRHVLKKSAFVTHLTPLIAGASNQIYSTSEKSKIIHNGIDISEWNPYLNTPEQNYMLAIGRLEPEKGFPILLEAYANLRAKEANTSLIIAGTGSIQQSLQAKAKAYGFNVYTDFHDNQPIPPASVIFPGYVRAQQKKCLFAQAKLILFATQPQQCEEAFGIVQLEAMAAGKAMIASDTITTRYLQTLGLQADIVRPDDYSDWAKAMHLLLVDDERRRQMGKINQKAILQFDWNLIAKQYADVYLAVKNKQLDVI